MKRLLKSLITSVVAAVVLIACSSAPFVPNTDNDLLVGKWKITQVVADEALGTGAGEIAGMVAARYELWQVFEFKNGSGFSLTERNGDQGLKGAYGISADNKELSIQKTGDEDYLLYSIELKGSKLVLNSLTAGETTNLELEKQ